MVIRIRTLYTATLLIAVSAPAMAGDWGVTGSVAVTSDYRFRAISQNDRHFAPQGSLNVTGPDGWYAGTWASAVDFDDHADTSIEWDMWFGKHFDLGSDFDLNVQPYLYAYPDHDSHTAGFHDTYFELINTLTKKIGDLTLTGTVAWSPDWFAESGTGWWVYANASYPITDWVSISGGVGHQSAKEFDDIKGIGWPYTHWDVGATFVWKAFSLDVRYIDTSISETECAAFNGAGNGKWCTGTVLATLTYNFTLL